MRYVYSHALEAMKAEFEKARADMRYVYSHTHALEAMKAEFEKARAEQDSRHAVCIQSIPRGHEGQV